MITRCGWMSVFHYFVRQITNDGLRLSSKDREKLEICCFESIRANMSKWTFLRSGNGKKRLKMANVDRKDEVPDRNIGGHVLNSVRDTHTPNRTRMVLKLAYKVNSCTQIM